MLLNPPLKPSNNSTAEGEATSDISIHAARRAIEDADIPGDDVDLIIVTSMNFDDKTPATAANAEKCA
ncbi:MAG: hypothetical protein OHK0023_12210 [Anaerolineae bacterium]